MVVRNREAVAKCAALKDYVHPRRECNDKYEWTVGSMSFWATDRAWRSIIALNVNEFKAALF